MNTQTKMILETESIPRVELDFMNNTHFEEIDMVKELGDVISSLQANDTAQNQKSLTQKLKAWQDHTIAHFSRENELMKETGFPAFSIHNDEHTMVLDEIESMISAWDEKKDIELVANYIFTQWPAWFSLHVNTMDMMTAKFAVMNGYSEPNNDY